MYQNLEKNIFICDGVFFERMLGNSVELVSNNLLNYSFYSFESEPLSVKDTYLF